MNIRAEGLKNYPIFADLSQKRVLVVGDGELALSKLDRLISAGADILVIASSEKPELLSICRRHQVAVLIRDFEKGDLKDVTMVFAASEHADVNTFVAESANDAGLLVNVANKPGASSFLVPSIVDRSPLLIAISSGGTSPVLARVLCNRIEAFIPLNYGALGQLYMSYRQRLKQAIPDWKSRRQFWSRVLNGRVAELIVQGKYKKADLAIDELLDGRQQTDSGGEVYLVGAGPGDPDLLTFRALRLMQQCDVVLYDRLVSDEILALVNKEAKHIYVGKRRDNHALPQESINQMLATLARQGRQVLRLKGGDPFIFGRGGEEIETLAEEGIDFQVVPGITAASGCSSYAGIPLTHRDHAQVCMFVTGHLKDGSVDLDWQVLSRAQQTVVIYMGLIGLPTICRKLQEHGLPADHPIAIVSQGTREKQLVITGNLGNLPDKVSSQQVKPPTLIIVGQVVTLREKLAWFDTENIQ